MSERTMGLSQEKSQNTTLWANIATLAVAAGILMSNIVNPVIANNSNSNNNTCPHTGDWTKIDSADMTLYPVDGAVEYCFKAGNFLTDSIPEGGFGQAGACNQQNIQGCGLSHWSYKLGAAPTPTPDPTPTDVQPTPTDVQTTPSPTPTTEPTPTDIPDNDPTPTPTPTVIQSDPTPTPTVVVEEPGETATLENHSQGLSCAAKSKNIYFS